MGNDKTNAASRRFPLLRNLGRVLEALGWPLLTGLALSAGSLLGLLWLTGSVYEGETSFLDDRARAFVHEFSDPTLTSAMRAVSFLGSTRFLVWAGCLVVVILAYIRRGRALRLFAVTVTGAMVLNETMKAGFMRPRPEPFYDYPPLRSYSYPSGHALASLCFYGILAWIVTTEIKCRAAKAITWIGASLLCFLIGLSRIYLGVHYPSDVLAGYLTAFVWTFAVAFGDHLVRQGTAKPRKDTQDQADLHRRESKL